MSPAVERSRQELSHVAACFDGAMSSICFLFSKAPIRIGAVNFELGTAHTPGCSAGDPLPVLQEG